MKKRCPSIRSTLLAALWVLILGAVPYSQAAAASLQLFVDASVIPGGNGSSSWPFSDIAAALAAGKLQRAKYSDIKISVAAGTYPVSAPIIVDYPVTLQGSNVAVFDVDGRPLPDPSAGTEAKVKAAVGFGSNPVIFVRPETGAQTVSGVTIARLTVEGTPTVVAGSAAETVKLQKAQGFVITDLIVRGVKASAGIDVSASSGDVKKSYVTGVGACGICVSAGTAASPASVKVLNNRSVMNGAGGLLLSGTSFPLQEVSQSLQAQVNSNDFSNNQAGNQGFGVRIIALGTRVPPTQSAGKATVYLNGNRLADNLYAVVVDAGFPRRNEGTSCDERTFTAQLSVQLNNNIIGPSSVTPALVSFTRSQVFQAANPISAWQYLHNASISISDPGLNLGGTNGFQIDHQEVDQFVGGTCSADLTPEPLNNTLTYNGIGVLAPLRNFSF